MEMWLGRATLALAAAIRWTRTTTRAGKTHSLESSRRVQMLAAPDQQVSLTDPDARSMATSGRGSGSSYNVQVG